LNKLNQHWIEKIIIGLNLCPFVKVPYQKGLIRVRESESVDEEEMHNHFLDELELIQQSSPTVISTTLLSFVNDKSTFSDFNDFVGTCEEIAYEAGLEEHFQLVVFHPEFQMNELEFKDVENFVGRSPYPTIHLLRNAEIELAQQSFADHVLITSRNVGSLKSLPENELKELFYYLNS
jgi:hypothetical protein